MSISFKGGSEGTALASASGTLNESRQRTYSRVYRVHSDDLVADDEEAVMAFMESQGFVIGTPHPSYAGAALLGLSASIAARATDGNAKLLWDVGVEWGPYNPADHSPDGDPLNQPIRFRLDPVTVEAPILLDVDGNPILNAAGDPFDPGVAEEQTQYVLTVLRNEVEVDVPAIMALSSRSRVNDAPWNGFPAKTVKALPIRIPERLWSQPSQVLYYPMEYQFHINFDTWGRKVVNQGLRELATSGGTVKRRQVIDAGGNPASTPVPLDADGHALPVPIDPGDFVILEFEVNEAIDFSIFNLDSLPY